MTEQNKQWLKNCLDKYKLDPRWILDVGSLDVNGHVRDLFPKGSYVGIDMFQGANVDRNIRGDEIEKHYKDQAFDMVICMNELEHDDNFLETLRQMKMVLKTGGHLVIVTPTFGFPIHRHPKDYWRFGEDAFREILFRGFEILELEEQPTKIIDGKGVNPCICAIGKKL